jgi:hypothetical protein
MSEQNPWQQKRKGDSAGADNKRVRIAKPGPRSAFRASSSSQSGFRTSSVVTLKDRNSHRLGSRRVDLKSTLPSQELGRQIAPEDSDSNHIELGYVALDTTTNPESKQTGKHTRKKDGKLKNYENIVRPYMLQAVSYDESLIIHQSHRYESLCSVLRPNFWTGFLISKHFSTNYSVTMDKGTG